MMKKLIVLLAVLMSTSLAATDLSNLSGQGCSYINGEWRCQIPVSVVDAEAVLIEDIGCFSTDGGYADLGCITLITLTKDVTVQDCKYGVVGDEIVYDPCQEVTLAEGDSLIAEVNPDMVDYSGCTKTTNESFYMTLCPYAGKKVTFSGLLDLGENNDNAAIITEMQTAKDTGVGQLVFDNLLYIILIVAIIIIAYWVFAPHKPMFKERLPKIKEEPTVTRREKRYGRKL